MSKQKITKAYDNKINNYKKLVRKKKTEYWTWILLNIFLCGLQITNGVLSITKNNSLVFGIIWAVFAGITLSVVIIESSKLYTLSKGSKQILKSMQLQKIKEEI